MRKIQTTTKPKVDVAAGEVLLAYYMSNLHVIWTCLDMCPCVKCAPIWDIRLAIKLAVEILYSKTE